MLYYTTQPQFLMYIILDEQWKYKSAWSVLHICFTAIMCVRKRRCLRTSLLEGKPSPVLAPVKEQIITVINKVQGETF